LLRTGPFKDALSQHANSVPFSMNSIVSASFCALCVCLALVLNAITLRAAGRQLTGSHAPTSSQPVPPTITPATFSVPDGSEMRLFASEPDVVNPVAMDWDERGRLWVLELFEYPQGAKRGKNLATEFAYCKTVMEMIDVIKPRLCWVDSVWRIATNC